MEVVPSGGGGKRSDPYEFDEDGTAPNMDGFKRAPGAPPGKVNNPIWFMCQGETTPPTKLNKSFKRCQVSSLKQE